MIGRFTESKDINKIRNHLIHGRIVYMFDGENFIIISYDYNKEMGIMKCYDIMRNMEPSEKQCDIFEILYDVKKNINEDKYHYLLYYGDLTIDNSIYDFMNEFYNPMEELPVIVVTAMVGADYIKSDISYPCKVASKVLIKINELIKILIEEYLYNELESSTPGCYSIFSIWLKKNKDAFELVLQSKYKELIDMDTELSEYKKDIFKGLHEEMKKVGVPFAI